MLIVAKQRSVKLTNWYVNSYKDIKDIRARAAVDRRLRQASRGNFGNYRYLGDGLFELKIAFGPGYRVYFSLSLDGELILVFLTGKKDSQERDIKKAKNYLKESI